MPHQPGPSPTASDFPPALKPILHLPPDNKATNAVIFLPGLGDTSANFSSFSRALNLPDALAITINPPFPLPFPLGPGDQWSEDLHVDTTTGELDSDSPLTKSVELVAQEVISRVLVDKFRYRPDHIHLFGFGQGGSVALTVPLHPSISSLPSLGGVISVGGALPLSAPLTSTKSQNKTPVLLLSGSKSPLAAVGSSPLNRIKATYEFVTYHQWKKADDSLPKNRDEALPMMQFWARRLRSRRGVPDDAIEIT
ncbi:hypothetical protein AYL99_03676 [Fonsecaea erecta]|uniref:Phospholipase/carboxylesterase/thioesterase domain-containing protein n=1 Tax=Fonsecaea erecta TaxID=1367422 RepID=A0A178ZQK9_9EURO|nr:hypothetical protein AYL99_03676 [Fonsecaea erecta]OAP61473.1 hypothetical protein AYL99_03676 [Fonsecaea erecta]